MSSVGIIANPASGKDIRRLVAHATVFDNMEKVNLVKRILLGMQATGVKKIYFMPDYFGIGLKALENLDNCNKFNLDVEFLPMEITGTQTDSLHAASMLKNCVNCLVTLGGDGTNRVVVKGCGDVPILPVSTGTNNVFPIMLEGTIAGLAAGFIATGKIAPEEGLVRHKKLDIYLDGKFIDIALVDAVLLKEQFIGSRAIWDVTKIDKIFATRGSLNNIGIVSVVGGLESVRPDDPYGVFIEIGPGGKIVKSALGPGLIVEIPVKSHSKIVNGTKIAIGRKKSCIIAVDGEREIQVDNKEIEIKLNPMGPMVVDVQSTLNSAAKKGLMIMR